MSLQNIWGFLVWGFSYQINILRGSLSNQVVKNLSVLSSMWLWVSVQFNPTCGMTFAVERTAKGHLGFYEQKLQFQFLSSISDMISNSVDKKKKKKKI